MSTDKVEIPLMRNSPDSQLEGFPDLRERPCLVLGRSQDWRRVSSGSVTPCEGPCCCAVCMGRQSNGESL